MKNKADPFAEAEALIKAFPKDEPWHAVSFNFDDFLAAIDEVIAGKASMESLSGERYFPFNEILFMVPGVTWTAENLEKARSALEKAREGFEASRMFESRMNFRKDGFLPARKKPSQMGGLSAKIAQRAFNRALDTEDDRHFRMMLTDYDVQFIADNKYPSVTVQALEQLQHVRRKIADMLQPLEGGGYKLQIPPAGTGSAFSDLHTDFDRRFFYSQSDIDSRMEYRDSNTGARLTKPPHQDQEATYEWDNRVHDGSITCSYRITDPECAAWVEKTFLGKQKDRGREI